MCAWPAPLACLLGHGLVRRLPGGTQLSCDGYLPGGEAARVNDPWLKPGACSCPLSRRYHWLVDRQPAGLGCTKTGMLQNRRF